VKLNFFLTLFALLVLSELARSSGVKDEVLDLIESASGELKTEKDYGLFNGVLSLGGGASVGLRPFPDKSHFIRSEKYQIRSGLSLSQLAALGLKQAMPVGLSFDTSRSVEYYRIFEKQGDALLKFPKPPFTFPTSADDVAKLKPGTIVRIPMRSTVSIGKSEGYTLAQLVLDPATLNLSQSLSAGYSLSRAQDLVIYRDEKNPNLVRMQVTSSSSNALTLGVHVGSQLGIVKDGLRVAEEYVKLQDKAVDMAAQKIYSKFIGRSVLSLSHSPTQGSAQALKDYTYDISHPDGARALNEALGQRMDENLRVVHSPKKFEEGFELTESIARDPYTLLQNERVPVLRNFVGKIFSEGESSDASINLVVYRGSAHTEKKLSLTHQDSLMDRNFQYARNASMTAQAGWLGWRAESTEPEWFALWPVNEQGAVTSLLLETGYRVQRRDQKFSGSDFVKLQNDIFENAGTKAYYKMLPELEKLHASFKSKDQKGRRNDSGDIYIETRLSPLSVEGLRLSLKADYERFVEIQNRAMSPYEDFIYLKVLKELGELQAYRKETLKLKDKFDDACRPQFARRLAKILMLQDSYKMNVAYKKNLFGPDAEFPSCLKHFQAHFLDVMTSMMEKDAFFPPEGMSDVFLGVQYRNKGEDQSTIISPGDPRNFREQIDNLARIMNGSFDPVSLVQSVKSLEQKFTSKAIPVPEEEIAPADHKKEAPLKALPVFEEIPLELPGERR